ncbi:MAG: hypothetical protein ACLQOO_20635 [Terriglobia bacterium]
MVAPSNSPPPAGPEPKPKRKYTVSEKVLAANRAKLAQANADPEKKYRPTPKRLASTYANCLKAREGKRQKRKRGQATGVKYGLAVTDLYSTLGLADASREELDEHYRLFRGVVHPRYDDEDKFTKALAECSWRRSQVLHVHAVDGAMLMKARLIMACNLPDDVAARALARLMMDVFNRRRPDLEEQLGILTRHFERLSYVLLLLRGEHEGFGEKIHWGPHGRQRIDELLQLPAEALGNPFVSGRQVGEILREKSNEIKPLAEMKWKGKEKEQQERQEQFQKDCEEATYGGPSLGGPDKVKWAGATAYVKDGGQTQAVVRPAEGPAENGQPTKAFVMVEGTAALEAGLRTDEWSEEEERKLVAELRRQWIETSEQLRQEGKETVGGLGMDELEQVLEAGFGIRGSGFAESEAVDQESEGAEADVGPGGARPSDASELEGEESPAPGDSAKPEPRIPNPADAPSSSPTPDSPLPTPDDPPDLREVTATAWDRVRFLEWWSRWERREMTAILQRTGEKARGILDALLRLFRGYKKILFEARHYEAKLQDALFRFLSQLYGGDPGFKRPSPVWTDRELYQQMMKDMEGAEAWGE